MTYDMEYRSTFYGIKDWDGFKLSLEGKSSKEKGDAFELLTNCYLQLEPKYKSIIKHVWLLREVSDSLRLLLNLPDTDQGIDLIAETIEGEYWAIQCKYRDDESGSLTWRDVSTFAGLTFGRCKNISFGLICTTSERFTSVLKHQERIGFCTSEIWRNLDRHFFTDVQLLLSGKDVRYEPYKPRPHQKRAVTNAFNHFVTNANSRGKLIMPCGSGKSLTALWIAEKLAIRKILVAVPSLALIRQNLQVWLKESIATKRDVRWICVASDESVGQISRDDISVLTQDLGIPTMTNVSGISQWLKTAHAGTTIVFSTYQSGKVISESAKKSEYVFDLGIMDEAHKTVGQQGKLFNHLLFDKNIKIRRRLFMTATERRYAGKSDKIISMEDRTLYGDTFELLTFKDAIEVKPAILSDYKIVTMIVQESEIGQLIEHNAYVLPDKGNWSHEVEADMLASAIALRKAMKRYPIKHTVSFHNSISKAVVFKNMQDELTKIVPSYDGLLTFHVSGKLPTSVRDRVLRSFSQLHPSLITNARCLSEGVDVPKIDCVLFADSRQSIIDIVQATGRALRPYPGKGFGYVLIPVVVKEGQSQEDFLRSGSFSSLLLTLRALGSNDERIIEYFRAISSKRRSSGQFEIDIDEKLSRHIDTKAFVNAIKLRCWNKLAKLSWRPFKEAREFARSLKFKSSHEWRRYVQTSSRPADIPAKPAVVYRNFGFINFGDWLGTGIVAPNLISYRPYEKAKKFARKLKIKSQKEWRIYCKGGLRGKPKLPDDIPAWPPQTYSLKGKNRGWISWTDWLGSNYISTWKRAYRPFKKARNFARKLGLKSWVEWRAFRLPNDIPRHPDRQYRNRGWKGTGDWLGTGRIASQIRVYRPFEEARKFAQGLALKNQNEWKLYCKGKIKRQEKKPHDIPQDPSKIYKNKGWKGMHDWLGTNRSTR